MKLAVDLFLCVLYFVFFTAFGEVATRFPSWTMAWVFLASFYLGTGALIAFVSETKHFMIGTLCWLPAIIWAFRESRKEAK